MVLKPDDFRSQWVNFSPLNFPTVLIFPTIWKVSIFLAPMLNIPTTFEFGLNIQKFFDKLLEIRSKIM